jgi:hypothetical protein
MVCRRPPSDGKNHRNRPSPNLRPDTGLPRTKHMAKKSNPVVNTMTDAWQKLPRRSQHIICILFLAVLPIVLLPQVWQGQQLTQHDMVQWRAGAESLLAYERETGEQALWSHNMFSGMPAYVISNIDKYPALEELVHAVGGRVFPYLYLVLLLSGGYVLLVLLGVSPLGATFGAITIAFTTYIPIIIGAGHNTKFLAYVWIPWIFAGYRLLSQGRTLPGFAIFTLFFMLNIRAGHPQVTYYFLFLLAVWWLYDTIDDLRSGKRNRALLNTGLLTAGGLLAALSVLPRQLALIEFTPHSIRGGSALAETAGAGLDAGYAFVWSQGWGELFTLVVPNLFGGGDLYWGPKPFTSGPHYLGALTAVFFILALFRYRERLVQIFLISGSLGLLFSLGNHFALLNDFMFNWFPLFNKFRTPEMWLMLSCFSFAVPATMTLDRIFREPASLSKRTFFVGGGLILALGIALLAGSGSMLSFEKSGERTNIARQIAQSNNVPESDPRVAQAAANYMSEARAERAERARGDILRYLILAGLALALVWAAANTRIPGSYLLAVVVLLSAVDMIQVGKRYIPDHVFVPRTENSYADAIEQSRGTTENWLQERVATAEGWSWRVLPLADNPFNNATPAYFYPSAGGYTGAKLSNYQDLIDAALFEGPAGINVNVLRMLNIRYLTYNARIALPGFSVANQTDRAIILQNDEVLPKAWFVSDVQHAATAREAIAMLNDPQLDVATTAIVEGAAGQLLPASADSQATVQVTAYSPHRIALETRRNTDGFLVLSEVYYAPGWKAFVNGTETPIFKTNYVLRGLVVPAGEQSVELTFEPEWLSSANTIGWIAHGGVLLLALGALISVLLPGQRRETPVDEA